MKLTKEEKKQIANSKEIAALHQTLAAVPSVAAKRIRDYINEENSIESILLRIQTMTDGFKDQYQSLLDAQKCPPGQHWDPVMEECVPDE